MTDANELRTIYPGCGADALRLYLTPKTERARRRRLKMPEPPRMRRPEQLDEALLLIDIEMLMPWRYDVMPFLESNAQLLAALFAERDGGRAKPQELGQLALF